MTYLKLGDSRGFLNSMADETIDLIVSDLPYRVISGGNKMPDAPKGMLTANDGRNFAHNDIKFDEYLPHLYRVLKDPGHAYFMVNFSNLEDCMRSVRAAGFDVHNLLVWVKQNCTPNRWYMKNCEYVIFARKGAAFPINFKGSKTAELAFENPVGDKSHPTEKPADLMRHYIENSSQKGDVVLDPFMGSGATGVAAKRAGRDFIGFEIDPQHYATACRRMGVMP